MSALKIISFTTSNSPYSAVISHCSEPVQEIIRFGFEFKQSSPEQKNEMLYALALKKLDLYKPILSNKKTPDGKSYYEVLLRELTANRAQMKCTPGVIKRFLYRASALRSTDAERASRSPIEVERYISSVDATILNDETLLEASKFSRKLQNLSNSIGPSSDPTKPYKAIIKDLLSENNDFTFLPFTGPLNAYEITITTLLGLYLYAVEPKNVCADSSELLPHQFLIHDFFHFSAARVTGSFGNSDLDTNTFLRFQKFSGKFLALINTALKNGEKEKIDKMILLYFHSFHEKLDSLDTILKYIIKKSSYVKANFYIPEDLLERFLNEKDSRGLLPKELQEKEGLTIKDVDLHLKQCSKELFTFLRSEKKYFKGLLTHKQPTRTFCS